MWLDAEFLTQSDSVFWNSHHEGADKFFLQLGDTIAHPFFIPFYQCSEMDSLFILCRKDIFFKDVFNSNQPPVFSKEDTVIKCFIKIRKKINPDTFISSFSAKARLNETSSIQNFLTKNFLRYNQDSLGIVWLDPLPIPMLKNRKAAKEAVVSYIGYFLDGRIMDKYNNLNIKYNDSLQLLEGLNYVIKKIDLGQTAKIILPSRLAFGENGSLNRTVPPFTPLLYEIKLIEIK